MNSRKGFGIYNKTTEFTKSYTKQEIVENHNRPHVSGGGDSGGSGGGD